jgi:hypothetical protein
MDALVLLGVLVLLALALGGLLAFAYSTPEPENRPAPPHVIVAREMAREEALAKIAARARAQDQREAAARISRGW